MTARPTILHGTCVARGGMAALVTGPSGGGKSDLALRFLDRYADAWLVADDQVVVARSGDRVEASAPAPLRGLLEVRGLGLIRRRYASAPLAVIIELLAPDGQMPRIAEPDFHEIEGCALPVVPLAGFEASAPLRLAIILDTLARHGFPGDDGKLG